MCLLGVEKTVSSGKFVIYYVFRIFLLWFGPSEHLDMNYTGMPIRDILFLFTLMFSIKIC